MKIIALRILTRKLLTSHWMAYYWLMLLYSHYNNSVQLSCLVMSDSLWLHGLQTFRLLCPSLSSRVCSSSRSLSQWCHPTISSSVVLFSSRLPFFPSIRVFSNESVLWIRWPKDWSFSFSISPSNEYSLLISFRIDWFDLLIVQGTLKCLFQHCSFETSILWRSTFFMVQLSHPYMTTGKAIVWLYGPLSAKWYLWFLILCLALL